MEADPYDEWVRRYVSAWNSNDPDEIADLFSENARYYTLPSRPPWEGRDEIGREWLENRDVPGDATFEYEVIAGTDDIGIVKGRTAYKASGKLYHNLWEVRLDELGRCREFVEWWIEGSAS